MDSTVTGRRAVVIGAGMGGLTAAAAVAKHFEHVTVLERDALPTTAEPRPGTPQARHAHMLLAGGLQTLNSLFPLFEDDLLRAGAVPLRSGLDQRLERPGFDPFPTRDLDIRSYAMSRPLLEFTVRQRVHQLSGVGCASVISRSRSKTAPPSRSQSSEKRSLPPASPCPTLRSRLRRPQL